MRRQVHDHGHEHEAQRRVHEVVPDESTPPDGRRGHGGDGRIQETHDHRPVLLKPTGDRILEERDQTKHGHGQDRGGQRATVGQQLRSPNGRPDCCDTERHRRRCHREPDEEIPHALEQRTVLARRRRPAPRQEAQRRKRKRQGHALDDHREQLVDDRHRPYQLRSEEEGERFRPNQKDEHCEQLKGTDRDQRFQHHRVRPGNILRSGDTHSKAPGFSDWPPRAR